MSRLRLPRARLSGDDAGFTLIEALVAIVIMGIAVTGIIGGYITASGGTNSHQSDARAAQVLINAVEQLRSATYVGCATTSTAGYTTALASATLPSAWTTNKPTIAMTSVQYWTGSGFSSNSSDCIDNNSALSTCAVSGDQGLGSMQLITVSVTSPDNTATDSLSFVKRWTPTCS